MSHVPYSPSMNVIIDEITDSFFAAPLLSIDETVLRAFPVDPFDVARTRRRPVVSAVQAEQLVGSSPLEELVAPPAVRTHYHDEPELGGAAVYLPAPSVPVVAAPAASVVAPVIRESRAAATMLVPALVVRPNASRGWLAGGLIALAGIFIGGALVCAALTRTEARVEPMPAPTAALEP